MKNGSGDGCVSRVRPLIAKHSDDNVRVGTWEVHMKPKDHLRAQRLIRERFEGGVSVDSERWLRAHLRECRECMALYESYSEAERQLSGSSSPIAPWELARLEELVVSQAQTSTARDSQPRPRARLTNLILVFASVAGLMAGAMFVFFPTTTNSDDGLQVRGIQSSSGGHVGFRVLAVGVGHDGQVAATEVHSGDHIRGSDRLVFLATSEVVQTVKVRARVNAWTGVIQAANVSPGINSRIGASVVIPESWMGQHIELQAHFVQSEDAKAATRTLSFSIEARD